MRKTRTGDRPDSAIGPQPATAQPPELLSEIMPQTIYRVFFGPHGLRAGWSLVIFYVIFRFLVRAIGEIFVDAQVVNPNSTYTAGVSILVELISFLAMLGAAAAVALSEQRRTLLVYNLAGPRRTLNSLSGLASGFLAISALIGILALGGWLQFGPIALSGIAILKYASLWGCAFLLVGCVEEGLFRCYMQFTLTRGINFWWALAAVAALCLDLALRNAHLHAGIAAALVLNLLPGAGNGGALGVYAAALLGLPPCLVLHLTKKPGEGFWYAAWVTSTFFGFIHTGNSGENWIGIFAASMVGFVFCVSVWVTGSAWWAIGCHAAWDWTETYFYGTADSGIQARGHFLSTSPAGNSFWSGGADGPEGSVLVLVVLLLLLVALVAIYGRKRPILVGAPAAASAAN
jgi:membrane protease YdiL (CAAX protease family)